MSILRDLRSADAERRSSVLALNNKHAAELSWLEAGELEHLLDQSFFAKAVGESDAFLIGFDQSADYASPNFLWFRERYERFAYVDRVVVSERARGRGLARKLYEAMFSHALDAGHTMVACEVNSLPPNPASDAFHAALGFRVVGEAAIYDGARSVRYFTRALTSADAKSDAGMGPSA